mgnify:CR=1 FL=1
MKLYALPIAVAALFAFAACDGNKSTSQDLKEAKEEVKEAVDDVLDRRPAEGVRDAAEDIKDAVKDAAEDTKEAVKEAAKEVKEATKDATQ